MKKNQVLKTDEGDLIPIDFRDLDSLVGSLCHVADLNSDREYREHLKSEIKMRCRQWLHDLYESAGYYDDKEHLELKKKFVDPE